MDTRQRQHIKDNKLELLRLTTISTELLVRLVKENIFSEAEKQNLERENDKGDKYKAVVDMYDLLITRPDVYDKFVNILREMRQTGAVNILAIAANNCEELLLDVLTNCIINDESTPLRAALSQLTTEDAKKILGNENISGYFRVVMSKDDPVLRVNGSLKDCNSLYMGRTLSNRPTIDPQIFKCTGEVCKDVFVVKGISHPNFAEIAGSNIICNLKSQLCRRNVTMRHIYLEKDDRDTDWTLLSNSGQAPIHFIIKEGAKFVLQVSNKITPILRKHAMSKKDVTTYITEEEFLYKLQSEVESGVCVCDIAGMGKSWLFENLARELRGRDCFVFLLSLPNLAKKYSEQKIVFIPGENLKFILEYASEQSGAPLELTENSKKVKDGAKLSAEILTYYVRKYPCKLYFFLDGFDEVEENLVEFVTILLNEVKHEGGANVKLCIASRPHKRAELEETFNVVAYDILPFNRDQQVKALMNEWNVGSDLDQRRLKKFATQCIESCENLEGVTKRTILGVPFKLHMLAKINSDKAKYFADKTRKICQIPAEITINSVYDLFREYVNEALERLSKLYKECVQQCDKWKREILNYHTWKAMEVLQLEKNIIEEFKRVACIDKFTAYNRIDALGLLYKKCESYKFLHRSFAEYFVGKFFADYWSEKLFMPSQLFEEYFFSVVLETATKRFLPLDSLNKEWKNVLIGDTSFIKGSILWFVNNLLNLKAEVSTSCSAGFESNKIYSVILGCIEEDLITVINLLKILLTQLSKHGCFLHIFEAPKEMFFLRLEEGELFDSVVAKKEIWLDANLKSVSVAYLLLVLAKKGSIDIGTSLFDLFAIVGEEDIQRLCTNLPQTWKSPMEYAIRRNDIDITYLFLKNKKYLNLEGIRIFNICLKGHSMTEADILKRQVIIKEILETYNIMPLYRNRNSVVKSIEDIADEPYDYNLDILNWICNEYKLTWSHTSVGYKTSIVRDILANSALTDEHFTDLLTVIFGFDPKNPQENINVEEIQNVFKTTADIANWFAHFNEITTLKTLVKLFEDFSQYNSGCKTLLHYSVQQGKLDWVKHLLSEGFDVNKRDGNRNSPLLCISSKNSTDITNILIEKGGDMHAINSERRTVAHMMVYSVHHKEYLQWFNHVLTKGPPKLWKMRDQHGKTAIDLMTEEWGEENMSRREILFEMQKYKAIDFKYQST